jgi:hypothetical protein
MTPTMKQNIRDKVNSYLKRAEDIKNRADTKPSKKSPVPSNPSGRDDEDPDKRRMVQKFEGQFHYIYSSYMNTIISL